MTRAANYILLSEMGYQQSKILSSFFSSMISWLCMKQKIFWQNNDILWLTKATFQTWDDNLSIV